MMNIIIKSYNMLSKPTLKKSHISLRLYKKEKNNEAI